MILFNFFLLKFEKHKLSSAIQKWMVRELYRKLVDLLMCQVEAQGYKKNTDGTRNFANNYSKRQY